MYMVVATVPSSLLRREPAIEEGMQIKLFFPCCSISRNGKRDIVGTATYENLSVTWWQNNGKFAFYKKNRPSA